MVQTDYIMRIIEQFAAFLWAIVFNKKAQNYDLAIEKINEAYNGLLHINPNEIKHISVNDIIKINTHNNVPDGDAIEIIANLLFQEADIVERINGFNEQSLNFYQKSLELFFIIYNISINDKFCKNIDEAITKLKNYNTGNDIVYSMYEYFCKAGLFGKAEDALFCLSENDYPGIGAEINSFYTKLLEKDDTVLESGNLPRKEIIEAMKHNGIDWGNK